MANPQDVWSLLYTLQSRATQLGVLISFRHDRAGGNLAATIQFKNGGLVDIHDEFHVAVAGVITTLHNISQNKEQ